MSLIAACGTATSTDNPIEKSTPTSAAASQAPRADAPSKPVTRASDSSCSPNQGNGGTAQGVQAAGQLPQTFPKDFPVFADAAVVQGDDSSGVFNVVWRSSASLASVYAFYGPALSSGVWELEGAQYSNPCTRSILFEKRSDHSYGGTLSISANPDSPTYILAHFGPGQTVP